jgi:hypothetical protein
VSTRYSWLMSGFCSMLTACAPSSTGVGPEPSVAVPVGEGSNSAPVPASEYAEGSATPSAGADVGEGSGSDWDASLPPQDCRECEQRSDSGRYREADGTKHSCGRFVGPVDCDDDDIETGEYCIMDEPCDPRCCR